MEVLLQLSKCNSSGLTHAAAGGDQEQRREQWCHDVSLRLPQASAVAPSGRPAWKPA